MRAFFAVLFLLASGGTALRAQTLEDRAPPGVENSGGSGHHSVVHVALWSLGGAVVGGWTGYVASQVAWSDWRDAPGRRTQRLRFSIAGSTLGLIGGFLIGHRSPAETPVTAPPPPDASRAPVTEDEIRGSAARSISELLREVRPQWLRSRGVDVLQPNRNPLLKIPGVRVYLNGGLIGGLDRLDEVSIDAVTRIEFFESAAAVLRWGAGNEDGAILLTTSAG